MKNKLTKRIRNITRIKPFITKDGSEIKEIFHPNNSSIKKMSFAEATVYPGDTTELHIHKKADEIYFILMGKGIMEIGGETATVKKGDSIYIPSKNKHRIKNTGRMALKIICASSPAYSHKDTNLLTVVLH